VVQALLDIVFLVAILLFGFQLWRVWRTGHVRWRVRKHHRDHRPVAFWLEIAACLIGLVVFAGLLISALMKLGAEGG
jgi:hypothetical protein